VTGCDQSTVEAKRRYPQLHFVECNVLDLEKVFGAGSAATADSGGERRTTGGPGTSHTGGAPFDLAVCSEVIEHVNREDQPRLLQAISAILRPEGELILTSPNGPVAAKTVEKLALQHELQPVENWLDATGLRRITEPYFDVVELGTLMFFPANIRKIGPLSRVYRALYEELGAYKLVDPILGGTLRGLYLALVARKKRA
jgi:SAM-dependent methyltransferase